MFVRLFLGFVHLFFARCIARERCQTRMLERTAHRTGFARFQFGRQNAGLCVEIVALQRVADLGQFLVQGLFFPVGFLQFQQFR